MKLAGVAPATSTGDNVAHDSASTGTIVVTLAPIVDGPFAISSINPGRDLALAIGASLAWFDAAPATHGFSGRRE